MFLELLRELFEFSGWCCGCCGDCSRVQGVVRFVLVLFALYWSCSEVVRVDRGVIRVSLGVDRVVPEVVRVAGQVV